MTSTSISSVTHMSLYTHKEKMKWNEQCIRIFFWIIKIPASSLHVYVKLYILVVTSHIPDNSFTLYWKIKCLKIIVLCDFFLPATKNPFKALSLFPPCDTYICSLHWLILSGLWLSRRIKHPINPVQTWEGYLSEIWHGQPNYGGESYTT